MKEFRLCLIIIQSAIFIALRGYSGITNPEFYYLYGVVSMGIILGITS